MMRPADNEVQARELGAPRVGNSDVRRHALLRAHQRLRVRLLALVIWFKLVDALKLSEKRPSVAERVGERLRHLEARPCIDGVWRVPARADAVFISWHALELQYVARQSLPRGVVMLLRAFPTVLLGFRAVDCGR